MLKQKICKCALCCWKIYIYLPVFVLLFWVYYPFVLNLFNSNTELLDNRALHTKPQKLSANFAKEFTDYYNDTFAKRKKLVKKFAKLKTKLGMDNGYSINGLNGWMFYDSAKVPDGYTLVDYYGEARFSDEELHKMAEGIKKAKDFYARQGIDYVIVIAPNKESMYSEYMPERMQKARVSKESRMDNAVKYFLSNTDVNVINFRDVLEQGKQKIEQPLYFRKDSHWNQIGGYVAYKKMTEEIKTLGYDVNVADFNEKMIKDAINYNSDLNIDEDSDIDFVVDYYSEVESDLIVEDNGFFHIWKTPKARNNKRILMIRDSFGMALLPYMQKDFAYGVFAHNKWNTREGLDKLINEYKPDLVVDELVERYFDRFLKYNDIYGDK